MNNEEFRHEWKYKIGYHEYLALKMRLQTVMHLDEHAIGGEYRINSLYFDNFDDKALREKLDGVQNRDKFRIRYYNDDDSVMFLEKKSKRNSLCQKSSCRITRSECDAILRGEIAWMQNDARALLRCFYHAMQEQFLKPKTLVSYTREPYVYEAGNVRVTFDREIRSGLYRTDLFEKCNPLVPVIADGSMILEVKYDAFLPEIIQMLLQSGTPRIAAFSKYAACRMYE